MKEQTQAVWSHKAVGLLLLTLSISFSLKVEAGNRLDERGLIKLDRPAPDRSLSWSCGSSLYDDGIYTLIFDPSGIINVMTIINERRSCVREDLGDVLDRHACIIPAIEWGAERAESIRAGMRESEKQETTIHAAIYSKSGDKYLKRGMWNQFLGLIPDITTEVVRLIPGTSAEENDDCEMGLLLKVSKKIIGQGSQLLRAVDYEKGDQTAHTMP